MIFSDWVAARDHIVQYADDAGLYALAGLIRENAVEMDFLKFCENFENVAREMNAIDWKRNAQISR
jgi:hypothetical protein